MLVVPEKGPALFQRHQLPRSNGENRAENGVATPALANGRRRPASEGLTVQDENEAATLGVRNAAAASPSAKGGSRWRRGVVTTGVITDAKVALPFSHLLAGKRQRVLSDER
jgi:hypothetical protein